ncbi:MAG: hypothetical protein ORN98_04135, partial [Alphaproteobacteria bacterium]|nr:hypothetical protein [Alphaproteobacteria bacterium]
VWGSVQHGVLWIGPDEYYVYTEDAAMTEKLAELARTPNPENSDQVGSIVDNSQRFVGFRLEGAGGEQLLSAYCPLDLSLKEFPVDKTTRTIMGKIDVLLWRLEEHKFHLEIARSFAQYGVSLLSFAQTNQRALSEAGLA